MHKHSTNYEILFLSFFYFFFCDWKGNRRFYVAVATRRVRLDVPRKVDERPPTLLLGVRHHFTARNGPYKNQPRPEKCCNLGSANETACRRNRLWRILSQNTFQATGIL